jgi:diaminopimelate epimerase
MAQQENLIPCYKAHGCQNTFILIDLLENPYLYNPTFIDKVHKILIKEECDDALILLPLFVDKDNRIIIQMIVLEPDKSIAFFCGNASRVVAKYLHHKCNFSTNKFALHSLSGDHDLFVDNDNYGVNMLATTFNPFHNSVVNKASDHFKERNGFFISDFSNVSWYFTQTCEPHLITFSDLPVEQFVDIGILLNTQKRDIFPKGININHVRIINNSTIQVITYERGVNRITKACGTGATSSAVLAYRLGLISSFEVNVRMLGGNLKIKCEDDYSLMIGSAEINLNNPIYI